jgi:hypothetical protein
VQIKATSEADTKASSRVKWASRLSSFEQEQLAAEEQIFEKARRSFFEAGQAFWRIRDGKLYRAQCKTFAAYCRGRWKWSASRARQYMRAVEVTVNLLKDGENGTRVPIPTSEYQVRPLVRLTPSQQREAWRLACEKGPDPTARQVAFAVYVVWRESIQEANIEITSKQTESSLIPEQVKQDKLWQEVRREMNELKEVATRWFEQLPGLEAQRAGMQKFRRWITTFKKEFPSQPVSKPPKTKADCRKLRTLWLDSDASSAFNSNAETVIRGGNL